LLRFYPAWYRSLTSSPLEDQLPWMTFGAIAFLDQILNKTMKVYEYGSGGSTLFFAKRCKEIISCEHDPTWAKKTVEQLEANGLINYSLQVFEPIFDELALLDVPSSLDSYTSSAPQYQGFRFKDYAQSIDQYPDQYFDVVIIDGRTRPSCFKHSVSKVRHNGYIVLDNAERENYINVHRALERGYWKRNFYGPGPYNQYFWHTCIWQKL
jgi:predicted O-methyltransferase YrrM